MAVRKILTIDNEDSEKSLRQPSAPVTDFNDSLDSLIKDMIDTMKSDIICVGLSAPQIGVKLQVAVLCPNREFAKVTIIINPTNAVESGKKDVKRESCMSLPDRCGNVERRENLSLDYQTKFGKKSSLSLKGFEARAVAHELDHLNGILYCDRTIGKLSQISFDEIRKKLKDKNV